MGTTELLPKFKKKSSELLTKLIEIRRHLHAHPELSFVEYKTAEYISSILTQFGIEHTTGVAKTGIVGVLKGENKSSNTTIALRADIDALPIYETTATPYQSKNEGVMHACGHDVHTTCLLGALLILKEFQSEWSGTIKFIFQPGEEKLPGGASLLIEEGVLENPKPNSIFGQHVFPTMETGKVGFRKGMYMASTDEIYITITGKGGHAAMPHTYTNPILIASKITTTLHELFMDEQTKIEKQIPTVLAFGKIVGNGATNVIPDTVHIEGTFRTMNEAWRKKAHELLTQTTERIAKSGNGSCIVDIKIGYPFLINNEIVTQHAIEAAETYLGKENVEELELRMTAEDFAYYSQIVPACFYRLGTGNKSKGITSNVHTSTFDIDENALEIGTGLMAWLAVKELSAAN
ncbi:MAG: amidohydrolase [Bacteroidetes bacterium]|nr:amidohydrolase [Bacteroidota bacterium]